MKPLLKIVEPRQNNAFHVMKVNEPHFFPSWHFHPECELMLVQQGTGIRFVGDCIERFQPGDLVFFGSNIPHLYRSDEEYYQKKEGILSKATVIYFKESFLGDAFLSLPDMAPVRRLLTLARQGMKLTGAVRDEVSRRMLQLKERSDGMERILDLLNILILMARTNEYQLLSGNAFTSNVNADDCERINKVYQFIMDNYTRNPTLEEVSAEACMSPTAFCRYFKSRTNKTYVQFLNEVKIGHACKLLIDNKLSISQVCFQTGFNHFNHFSNQFKKITGLTPGQYQHNFLKQPASSILADADPFSLQTG
ncbi:MAG TPA: AraC family transcriptional regulator [Puia sp.]|jgi:AraC-like DNA-binding protein|nr:AraC family transcriptional regulator [Puia sp.]